MSLKGWYIGNTTIRNAKRLKYGLMVLVNSNLHGNLEGKKNEFEFAKLLHESGVVFIKRLTEDSIRDMYEVSDVGRKWRAALVQLGFLKPKLAQDSFTVTPNGQRLLESNNLPSEQECFLRSLLAQQLPSPIEKFPGPVFSPLRIVLEVIKALQKCGLEPSLTKEEMGAVVQLTNSIEKVPQAIIKISKYREQLDKLNTTKDKKQYINKYIEEAASGISSQMPATLVDYADSNFRYLKLTGLFIENANKLRFASHKQTIINQILAEEYKPIEDTEEYLHYLWNGAPLPTDNAPKAIEAILNLAKILMTDGQSISLPNLFEMKEAELARIRFELEDNWFKVQETHYASRQSDVWHEILELLRALTKPIRRGSIVPLGEGPAYLEWSLWRAFLAINSLTNKPWESRRFRIDEEFYPIGPAPGGGPDLIFEFDNFVIVCEVTLTSSSRQEAAEGEPVRRHVADLVDYYASLGKRVYGLFIANQIDTNTAETFRIGVWYRNDESRMALDIVPLTLSQFADLFEAGFSKNKKLDNKILEQLIRECLVESRSEAPEWKRRITQHVYSTIDNINSKVEGA